MGLSFADNNRAVCGRTTMVLDQDGGCATSANLMDGKNNSKRRRKCRARTDERHRIEVSARSDDQIDLRNAGCATCARHGVGKVPRACHAPTGDLDCARPGRHDGACGSFAAYIDGLVCCELVDTGA
jgi:hypothetical protein